MEEAGPVDPPSLAAASTKGRRRRPVEATLLPTRDESAVICSIPRRINAGPVARRLCSPRTLSSLRLFGQNLHVSPEPFFRLSVARSLVGANKGRSRAPVRCPGGFLYRITQFLCTDSPGGHGNSLSSSNFLTVLVHLRLEFNALSDV